MKKTKLNEMKKGWFVGQFQPTSFSTDACEVAVKSYRAGDKEQAHYHKIANEVTLVLEGSILMCGEICSSGDIIVLEREEVTAFESLTDSVTVVVKVPGAIDDKFLV